MNIVDPLPYGILYLSLILFLKYAINGEDILLALSGFVILFGLTQTTIDGKYSRILFLVIDIIIWSQLGKIIPTKEDMIRNYDKETRQDELKHLFNQKKTINSELNRLKMELIASDPSKIDDLQKKINVLNEMHIDVDKKIRELEHN